MLPTGVVVEILTVPVLQNPNLTQEKFTTDQNASFTRKVRGRGRVYRTGDKGYLMGDGTLVVQGRIMGDTQIELRGFRIKLEDIETTITRESRGVTLRSVAAIRREGQLSYLVVFVEFADRYPVGERQAYLARLLNELPPPQYMRPNMLIPLQNIPLNSHGKVDRLVMTSLDLSSDVANEGVSVDLTLTEKALRDLWLEI